VKKREKAFSVEGRCALQPVLREAYSEFHCALPFHFSGFAFPFVSILWAAMWRDLLLSLPHICQSRVSFSMEQEHPVAVRSVLLKIVLAVILIWRYNI
jgi:hypothetical protein